jgi:uncharacterized RDD family membrane protein YckC
MTSPNIASQHEYASLNRKIIAFGIDIVIIMLVLFPISSILTMVFFGINESPLTEMNKALTQTQNADTSMLMNYLWDTLSSAKYLIVQFFIPLVLVSAYFVYFWAKMGASIGKLIMRCKIVDADTYRAITMKQALRRMAGHYLNVLTLGIGLFMADFTKRKQGLHDKLAGSVVVIKKRGSL